MVTNPASLPEPEPEYEDARPYFARYRQHIKDYADYLLFERGRSERTVRIYVDSIDRLVAHCGILPNEIEVADVRRFLRETDYASATKRGTVVAIKSWHRWGVLEGLWEPSALMAMHAPTAVNDTPPPLEPDEVTALLEACDRPREYRLLYLGLFGGLRIGEAASIDRKAWRSDRLRFVGKGSKLREVPIHPRLAELEDEILSQSSQDPANRGRPIGPDNKTNALIFSVAQLRRKSGVHFVAHQLRRTFATTLYEADIPYEVVGALLGHSAGITSLYAAVSWRKKLDAIASLDYGSRSL